MLSGAVGGPLVVGLLTPQRNAMTLAAKETGLSYTGLYRQVFTEGLFSAFRGGSRPVLAAVPQFTAIGPVYLMAENATGSSTLSMLWASIFESIFTFSAQSRNAQIQYNATRMNPAEKIQLSASFTGPGLEWHVARNYFAMMGIRVFSPYSLEVVRRVPGAGLMGEECSRVCADLFSSVVAATLSMPFNHVFSWSACTPSLERMTLPQRTQESLTWIVQNYKEQGSRLLARDLAVRISYTGLLFTGYRYVERKMVNL
jgi:hypothetical protein